ncbi:hypothetical protein ACFV9C_01400 [Kribbella sp. NPDC059898]|uniref:hypothetical protein n=1 Tax=Kribbella sp. NPDC059898 TaxID=3346995 RepID=UPI0036478B95
MDYKTFESQYRQLLQTARSLDADGFAAEVERLRAAADDVQPESDRARTVGLIKSLDNAAAQERDTPAVSEAMAAAIRAQRRANQAAGTIRDRINQIRAAIEEIGAIAKDTSPEERRRIIALTEPLSMLASSLEMTASSGPDQ